MWLYTSVRCCWTLGRFFSYPEICNPIRSSCWSFYSICGHTDVNIWPFLGISVLILLGCFWIRVALFCWCLSLSQIFLQKSTSLGGWLISIFLFSLISTEFLCILSEAIHCLKKLILFYLLSLHAIAWTFCVSISLAYDISVNFLMLSLISGFLLTFVLICVSLRKDKSLCNLFSSFWMLSFHCIYFLFLWDFLQGYFHSLFLILLML